jgi:antitoxin Phd
MTGSGGILGAPGEHKRIAHSLASGNSAHFCEITGSPLSRGRAGGLCFDNFFTGSFAGYAKPILGAGAFSARRVNHQGAKMGYRMREIRLKDAKATLSSLVDDAVAGKPSVITRHGKRQAVVVGHKEWERLTQVPSFGRLLMSAPLSIADLPRRNRKPIRSR